MYRDGRVGKARSHVPGKNAPMRLRPDFGAAVSLKNSLHRESGEEIAEPISHSNTSDGTLPQAIPGRTRLIGVGGAHDKKKSLRGQFIFLLQLVSFTVDGDPL